MNATTEGAVPAPVEATTPKAERQIGPETRTVRIFREVFAKSAAERGHLQPDLDAFLKLVLEDKDAKRSDKTYARKIYTDLLRTHGSTPTLPEWATKKEPTLSDQDIQDILTAVEEPTPTLAGVTMAVEPALDSLDELLLPPEPVPDPVLVHCEGLLDEFMKTNQYPFVRVFNVKVDALRIARFVALGTVLGTVAKGKHAGKKVNIHCTVAGFKRLRDAEDEHAHKVNGRPLGVSRDDETGLRKHIFCLKHVPGMKIRYWIRINDKDDTDRAAFIVFNESPEGWKRITRDQF